MDSHIMDKMQSQIRDNRESHQYRKFAIIYVSYTLVMLIAPFFDFGVFSNGNYLIDNEFMNGTTDPTENQNPFPDVARVLVWPMQMMDSLMWSVAIYFGVSGVKHYRFPGQLMELMESQLRKRELPDTIESAIDELMGWWELRRYYMRCIVQVYSRTLSPLIFAGIFGVIVLSCIIFMFVAREDIYPDLWDCLIMVIIATFVLSLLLLTAQNAVNYHKLQLEHEFMLRERLMEIQRNELNGEYDIDERTSRLYPEIVMAMVYGIEKNHDAIHVLGIKVDVNFMILLRSGASALAIAVVAALLDHWSLV